MDQNLHERIQRRADELSRAVACSECFQVFFCPGFLHERTVRRFVSEECDKPRYRRPSLYGVFSWFP